MRMLNNQYLQLIEQLVFEYSKSILIPKNLIVLV